MLTLTNSLKGKQVASGPRRGRDFLPYPTFGIFSFLKTRDIVPELAPVARLLSGQRVTASLARMHDPHRKTGTANAPSGARYAGILWLLGVSTGSVNHNLHNCWFSLFGLRSLLVVCGGGPRRGLGQERTIGLIGRGPLRVSHVLTVSVLTAGLVCAGFFTHPSSAYASAGEVQQTTAHVVTFTSQGTTTQHVTRAATVGAFLKERGIIVGERDYLSPSPDVPLSDKLVVIYRAAVPVKIVAGRVTRSVTSSAEDVGALLEEQGIRLGRNDDVTPSLSDDVPANGIVRIARVLSWERMEKRTIEAQTIHRLDFSMTPGTSKVITPGVSGEREVMVHFTQRDGGSVSASVIGSRVIRRPHPRVVAEGVGEYEAFERFAERGIERTAYIAESAMHMVATAYTASCYGCSGITAIGRPAGHGIVAVDPSVIPLGTRLYIPGYGFALAGDTGGAIHGNRIDLGFNSLHDAMLFGRREVVVYRLK